MSESSLLRRRQKRMRYEYSPEDKMRILGISGYTPRGDGSWVSPGQQAVFRDLDAAWHHRRDLDAVRLNVAVLRRLTRVAVKGEPIDQDLTNYLIELTRHSENMLKHFTNL